MKNTLLSIAAILMMAACSETQTPAESVNPSSERKKNTTTTPFTVVYVDSTDWNITWDTSICGSLLMRWTDQNRPAGSTNYYFFVSPMAPTCAGGLNTTSNVLYYTYGYGCSFWPSSTYSVSIRYNWTDSLARKIYVHTSTAVTVNTGRGAWYCNN